MGRYRPKESYLGRTREKRAAQLANLRFGPIRRSKSGPIPSSPLGAPENNPFDPIYKDDPIRFIEDHFYLTPERCLIVLDDWQKQILRQIFERDPTTGLRRYTMAVVSAPKKTGKTSLAAAIILWFLVHGELEGEIIMAAYSGNQSTYVVYKKLCRSIRMNRHLLKDLAINKDIVENKRTATTARVVSVSSSVAGLNPNLVLFDELHAYREVDSNMYRDFFDELTVSPTRKEPLCLITSYAGTGQDTLFYEIYEKGLAGTDPKMFFFWSHDPFLSPRMTKEILEDKRNKHHPNTFARLFENRWTQGEKQFIDMVDYDKCVDSSHAPLFEDFHKELAVYLGIDIGVKDDCSAVVAVAKQVEKIVLIQHRIWRPRPNDPVIIEDVENYIYDLHCKFRVAQALFDPSQCREAEQRLKQRGVNMVECIQAQGPNIEAAQNLYHLLRSGKLKLYKADDLRQHLQHAVVRESARGFQIEKKSPSKKVDAAVALAMACLAVIQDASVEAEVKVADWNWKGDESSSPGRGGVLSGDWLLADDR